MSSPSLLLLGGGLESHRGPSRRGIEVLIGGAPRHLAIGLSRKVAHIPGAPEVWDAAYPSWLDRALRALPGAVILACQDDQNWWLARQGTTGIAAAGALAVAPFDAVMTANVKSRMSAAAANAGIATPKTVLLASESGVAEAVAQLRFPMMLKPQMRIGMEHWTRGKVVRNAAELRAAFEWYRREVKFKPAVIADAPEAVYPLAQEYVVRPGRVVRHITGYLARSGGSAVRAHRKLLQEPLRFGSGVCFETEPVDEALAARLLEMLRAIGYHGMFEAEFLQHRGELLLIDLNVRPYNGLSLTLEAGLDLVTCAYLEATGEEDALRAELEAARAVPFREIAWCNHAALATLLAGQWVSGGLSAGEARGHLAWAWRNRSRMVNPGASRDDLPLAAAYFARHAIGAFVSPRDFLGRYFRSGLDR